MTQNPSLSVATFGACDRPESQNNLADVRTAITPGARELSGAITDFHEHPSADFADRQKLNAISQVMDAVPDRVWSKDIEGRYLTVNRAFAEFYGMSETEILGKTVIGGALEALKQKTLAEYSMVMETGCCTRTESVLSSGGRQHIFEVSKSPLRDTDGRIIGLVGMAHDITQHVALEEKLTKALREQESLTRKLTEAKELADAANRAKSGFLATMSHEIRTPLYGLVGTLELLQSSAIDAHQSEGFRVMREAAETLQDLIGNVLDFSKIEAGELSFCEGPFDARQMLTQCHTLFRDRAAARGVPLHLDIDPTLCHVLIGDKLRISQIVNNLLANAVKFTSHGSIRLSLRAGPIEAGRQPLVITVSDTGIGIDAQCQKQLFNPFIQSKSSAMRHYGGSGLGLSICKRLADAMGADLSLESEMGKGSVFRFSLRLAILREQPLNMAQSSPNEPHISSASPQKRKRVLVADDHSVNLRMLVAQLKRLGYEADFACNGKEALALWREGDYAAVISDCHMPEMDGYQLAQAIRAAEASRGLNQHIPVLACTASALVEEADQCREAGFDEVMVKPVSLRGLDEHLRKLISPPLTECAA